jgi:amino acid transporter
MEGPVPKADPDPKPDKPSLSQRAKIFFLGASRNIHDPRIFHQMSLIAFFAWIGLGSDGISSSCYGPEEAFITLGSYHYLGIFVAIATAVTVFIISTSYKQIIELFPGGGGGYFVASKLLSPAAGVVAGCALIIDYVLTISISISSGADALFSFMPEHLIKYKLVFSLIGIVALTVLNMRGLKETLAPLVPLFLTFVATHAFIIVYGLINNSASYAALPANTALDISKASSVLGFGGMIFLVLKAYSMGAGTFTGIEAVSNSINIFREPRVENAKKTMNYMALSLSFVVLGIMFSYVLFKVIPTSGKTLNAVLFENATAGWPVGIRNIFVWITLLSEALLLFVAAQTGFIDGPRVIANMAKDRLAPTRFSTLSDRLVARNGIALMGAAALAIVFLTSGSVKYIVVLYSINVFITFTLSQLGMVRHWWRERSRDNTWFSKFLVNGVGLMLTAFILVTVVIIKFAEGGWITIMLTGGLAFVSFLIKRHYNDTFKLLKRLDDLVSAAIKQSLAKKDALERPAKFNPKAKTAVLFVNGFNGLGMHTLLTVIRSFGPMFKNFVFVQIGVLDTGNFKGQEEVEKLQMHCNKESEGYVEYMKANGYFATSLTVIGSDVVDEAAKLAPELNRQYKSPIFFGGQLVFEKETVMTRFLHNYIVFSMQKALYQKGITFVILPIRVY